MKVVSRALLRRQLHGSGLRRGRRGVTDVPLELLIIIIILAIVVPIIVAALITYTNAQTSLAIQEQASNLRDVVVQTYDDGINTTLLLTLNLPRNGCISAGEYLWDHAGNINYYATRIGYNVCGQTSDYIYVDNGAMNVLLTNITCTYPALSWSSCWTQTFHVTSGQATEIAVIKLAPGGFFAWGHSDLPVSTNLTTGFVNVEQVYP